MVLQWLRTNGTQITLPISYTTTNYAGSWFEVTTSWDEDNMSRRQMQIQSKTITGFKIYSNMSNRWYIVIGY